MRMSFSHSSTQKLMGAIMLFTYPATKNGKKDDTVLLHYRFRNFLREALDLSSSHCFLLFSYRWKYKVK